jgi:hypothetical protein
MWPPNFAADKLELLDTALAEVYWDQGGPGAVRHLRNGRGYRIRHGMDSRQDHLSFSARNCRPAQNRYLIG